jgi:arylsulfatase A-like enzyme
MYQESVGNNHGFSSHLINREKLKKNMAIYYGMTSFMDNQIGRILDSLDKLGIADNTIIVFTTDHGHFLGQHGLVAKGAFHYEDMVKIPFLARWPNHIPKNKVSESLQGLVDLAPTFLTAAGIKVPGLMQGVNQLDVWCGKSNPARDHVIIENRHQPTKVHLRTFVDNQYKMTLYRGQTYGELFDLKKDPNELHNLWNEPSIETIKCEILRRFMDAEIQREPTRLPRIAGA